MVIGAFPIAKLSALLVKQISKPIANICKEKAKNSPFFRTYVCMPPAQFYNWCEVKAKMWILNLGKPVNIPVLSQDMAIELGANLLGETVIFSIGAGILIFEYNRQSKKETAKEAKREEEMRHITSTITDLYFTVQQQQTQLRELERLIHSISGKRPTTPPPTLPKKLPQQIPERDKEKPDQPPAAAPHNVSQIVIIDRYYDEEVGHPAPASSTPYPDRGVILKSLNYIQMDALSSLFPSASTSQYEDSPSNVDLNQKEANYQKRETAILSEALHNIENNFRSLF